MIRRLATLVALSIAVPAAAQQEVDVAAGETIPDLRACIDYIGRGSLASIGEPEPIDNPDDLLGHSIYRYRFVERTEVVGRSAWKARTLVQAGHALSPVRARDALVFLGRKDGDRFVSWAAIRKDRRGKGFLPIFAWPDPGSRYGWTPLAIRKFARPVSYRLSQSDGRADDDPDLDTDLFVRRQGRVQVRYGLYLADIPALMRTARDEPCWR